MGGGTPAYTASKVALNALTRMLAAELRRDRVLVNAVCPGWVATDMGGPGGRPVAEGAASVVWAATLPDSGPTGGFFRDGSPSRGSPVPPRQPPTHALTPWRDPLASSAPQTPVRASVRKAQPPRCAIDAVITATM